LAVRGAATVSAIKKIAYKFTKRLNTKLERCLRV
jgi:hypothetical protein